MLVIDGALLLKTRVVGHIEVVDPSIASSPLKGDNLLQRAAMGEASCDKISTSGLESRIIHASVATLSY